MKKITLFLLLLITGASNAQNVEIDEVLKGYLVNYSSVDTNGDGEIQVSEAEALTTVSMDFSVWGGIPPASVFPNITDVTIVTYTLDGGVINNLDFSAVPQLTKLHIDVSRVLSLNLSPLTQLEELYINFIYGYGHSDPLELTGFSLGVHPQLKTFSMTGSYYSGFDSIDFSGCPLLEHITENAYNLTAMDISVCPNLKTVDIDSFYHLESFTVGSHPNLTDFSVEGTLYSSPFQIDFSECPSLNKFDVSLGYIFGSMQGSEGAVYVNLKNGNVNYNSTSQLTITNSADDTSLKSYICIDEGESDNLDINIESYPTYGAYNTAYYSSYCLFNPGGNYNTIAGSLTFDAGNDGCSASDFAMPFAGVTINDGTTSGYSSMMNGGYNFYTQAGTFTLTPQFENDWFTATPATVAFADNNNNTISQNFCVTANGVHNDAEVTIVPILAARPGFDAIYKIIYKNKGNQTLSGDVTFTFDDAVLDYVSASPVETTSATGSLSWNYTNLLPFESREILLTLNVNSPQETPAVNIGDVLNLVATITPLTGDETQIDNTFALKQTVVGSYDPNNITCLEGATVNPNKIGDYLHYNINFENTGTYPASFVVVKDIIDASKFDVSSLVVLNASHAVEARVTGNKLEFYFDDINLAANGGKGNVTFKIKSLESLAVNSSVMQKADIFFDYNLPVVTNEATTTYALLNAPGFTKDASVKIYPNPAKNVVSISAESAIQSVQLFDVQGRLLEATSVNDVDAMLDIAYRANGIYFIKIATEKGVTIEKLVKE